jgi:hypothetical protein
VIIDVEGERMDRTLLVGSLAVLAVFGWGIADAQTRTFNVHYTSRAGT